MSSQKNIKLTAAGQLALKNITIAPVDRDFLEQFLVRTGYVLAVEEIVAIENEDLLTTISRLKGNGWIRETVMLIAAPPIQQPTVQPVPPDNSPIEESNEKSNEGLSQGSAPPQIPETITPIPSQVPTVTSLNVTEEEKARSFEQFMKVMGHKS